MSDVIIALVLIGAPVLAILSVWLRKKKTGTDVAGYVFNGKRWVNWLFLLSVLGVLWNVFIEPIPFLAGRVTYDPQWKMLIIAAIAVVLYICYIVIAYKPATAEEIEVAKQSGESALGHLAESSASMFKGILAIIGGALAAIPGILWNVLNPVLAVKRIGGVLYKIVPIGGNLLISIASGLLGLAIMAVLVLMVLYIASVILALLGTFTLGVVAIVKFITNLLALKKVS